MIELCIGLAVLAMLIAFAVPGMRGWLLNSQLRSTAESIQNGLQLARSEAVRRNVFVTFTAQRRRLDRDMGEHCGCYPDHPDRDDGERGQERSGGVQNPVVFSGVGRVTPAADHHHQYHQLKRRHLCRIRRPDTLSAGDHHRRRPDPHVRSGCDHWYRCCLLVRPTMTMRQFNPVARGSVLLEALVGMLIFSIGILALVAMQAESIRNTPRLGTATTPATWPTRSSDACGPTGPTWPATPTNPAARPCASTGTASTYGGVSDWLLDVTNTLPNSTATRQQIIVGANNLVTVGLCWQTGNGTPHNLVVSAQIQG